MGEPVVRSSSFIGMFHPQTWAATRETWRRGHRIHRAGARVTQLGATFAIAPGPRLLYEHLDADSTDHAPIDVDDLIGDGDPLAEG